MNKINWKIDQVDDSDGWILVSFVDDDTNEIIRQQRFKWQKHIENLINKINTYAAGILNHENDKIKKIPPLVPQRLMQIKGNTKKIIDDFVKFTPKVRRTRNG